jgi:hypothetical protein
MGRSKTGRRPPRMLTTLLACTLLLSSGSGTAAFDQGGFPDVSDDSPHANDIYTLAEAGVMGGYPDGTFRPDVAVTRGEVATVIVAAFELDAAPDTDRFNDIDGTPHEADIGVLGTLGVVEGYADGTFRPSEPITRATTASIIGRVLEVRPVVGSLFPDVGECTPHAWFINALHQRDVIRGYEDGTFRPDATIQRDQFASIVRRAMEARGIGADLPEPARYIAREITSMAADGDLDGLARLALQGPLEQPRGTPGPGFTASFAEEVSTPEELVALWERIGREEVLDTLDALVSLPDWYRTTSTDAQGEPVTIYVTPRFMHEPTEANRAVLEARLGAEVVEAAIIDGQWLGWRLGVTAEGDWRFFVTCDCPEDVAPHRSRDE